GRAVLPVDPRLPGAVAAGVADAEAEGVPARAGGAAAGGSLFSLERPAREPPPPLAAGMGEYPAADAKKGLCRPPAPDDEAVGVAPRLPHGRRRGPAGLSHLGRHRSVRQPPGVAPGGVAPHRKHDGCSHTRPATGGLPPLGRPTSETPRPERR